MKKLRGKLNSENGAVIVIALLFFLVCALVAAVIVAAASMNAGRIEKRYDEQKAYLAASSAAQLLQEDLAGKTFKAEREYWEYDCGKSHAAASGELKAAGYQDWVQTQGCEEDLSLGEFITYTAFKLCQKDSASSEEVYSKVYTLKTDKTDDVTTTVTLQLYDGAEDGKKYDIKCLIESVTTEGSSYTMSLYIDATALSENQAPVLYENKDAHQVVTERPVWNGKEWVTETETTTEYSDYHVTTTKLTVTWPKGSIQKGDA